MRKPNVATTKVVVSTILVATTKIAAATNFVATAQKQIQRFSTDSGFFRGCDPAPARSLAPIDALRQAGLGDDDFGQERQFRF